MDFKLKTWYKNKDRHGNSTACLSLYVESANHEYRDRIRQAIEKAMAPAEPVVEKASAIGFQAGE